MTGRTTHTASQQQRMQTCRPVLLAGLSQPDPGRVRVAEILARGDQPKVAVVDHDRSSQVAEQRIYQALDLLNAHSPPSATNATTTLGATSGRSNPP
jgi:hypothetical protein